MSDAALLEVSTYGKTHWSFRVFFTMIYELPAFVGAVVAGVWFGPLGAVVGVFVWWTVHRWIHRRVVVRDSAWVYRGLLWEYRARLDQLRLEPLDENNYAASVGTDKITVYGYAFYPAPGHPGRLVGSDTEPESTPGRSFQRRLAGPKPIEIVGAIVILAVALLDFFATRS